MNDFIRIARWRNITGRIWIILSIVVLLIHVFFLMQLDGWHWFWQMLYDPSVFTWESFFSGWLLWAVTFLWCVVTFVIGFVSYFNQENRKFFMARLLAVMYCLGCILWSIVIILRLVSIINYMDSPLLFFFTTGVLILCGQIICARVTYMHKKQVGFVEEKVEQKEPIQKNKKKEKSEPAEIKNPFEV